MNLERVEELTLNYLAQAPQPVVGVETLLHFIQREESLAKLSFQELLDFLRRHQDITVLEGLGEENGLDPVLSSEAGLYIGPRAVLNTRVPPQRDMLLMLVQQLDQMQLTLNTTLSHALQAGDSGRAAQARLALDRAQTLRERFSKMLQ